MNNLQIKAKLLVTLLAVFMTGAFVSAASADKVYAYKVGSFSRLDLAGRMNVECRHNPDSTGYIIYKTHPQYNKVLKYKLEGGVLNVWTDVNEAGRDYMMDVIVYAGPLDKILNGTDGDVVISSITLNRESLLDVDHNSNGVLLFRTPVQARNVSLRVTGRGSFRFSKPLSASDVSLVLTAQGEMRLASLSCTALNAQNVKGGRLSIDVLQTTDCIINNALTSKVGLKKAVAQQFALTNRDDGAVSLGESSCNAISIENLDKGTVLMQTTDVVQLSVVNGSKNLINLGTIQASQCAVTNRGTGTVNASSVTASDIAVKNIVKGIVNLSGVEAASVSVVNEGQGTVVLDGKCNNFEAQNAGKGKIERSNLTIND